jgi:predicted nucleotidyltransferase
MNLNEYKILNLILRENRPLFFREISKLSGVSIGGTQSVLNAYSEFFIKEERGKNVYYLFKKDLLTKYLKKKIEIEKTILFLKKNKILKEFFNKVLSEKISCLVFGSYAKDDSNKKSDLDLVVLGDKNLPEHLSSVDLHVVRLSKKEFKKMFAKRETLSIEVLKNHVLINDFEFFMEVFEEYGGY